MNTASAIGPTDKVILRVRRKTSGIRRLMEAIKTLITSLTTVMTALLSLIVALPLLTVGRLQRAFTGLRDLGRTVADGLPWTTDDPIVRAYRARNLPHLLRDVPAIAFGMLIGTRKNYGVLRLTLFGADGIIRRLGVVSHQLVTTAGVNKIVSVLNTVDATTGINFKYHGLGTGATAPAIGDTALQTEMTTAYSVDNTRATGSQTVGGSANIYRSVGTNTVDASVAVTEMGLLSQAATGGGTLLDRFTFAAVNMVSGDSLQTTVDVTFPAGS